MKSVAIGLTALVLTSLASLASAGEILLVSDHEMCDSAVPQDKAALVQARREGEIVIFDVTAELNCAHLPSKPELREWRNTATVTLPTYSPSGAAAMCLCTHKLVFQITNLYEGVRSIYYVQRAQCLVTRLRPNNSFNPKPLRGSA